MSLDGHFVHVEKHFSGLTIGIGNNGKVIQPHNATYYKHLFK